jgi:hypothetical protein
MTDRRPLIDGLKPNDPSATREEAFVYGQKPSAEPVPPVPPPSPPTIARQGRSPVSTRIRSDYAEALKRASLERQLKGETPYTVQDILEAALEPWLTQHGYLK